VKQEANTKVSNKLVITSKRYPPISAECAHVNEAPDVNNKIVFNAGIMKGSTTSIPFGGHTHPICGIGFNAEWKKAQKNAKKSITSETINKIIPKRNPCCTANVWAPSKVPSRTISRHHNVAFIVVAISPTKNKKNPDSYECIYNVNPSIVANAENDVVNGHGLTSTMWNECNVVLFKFADIVF